MRKAGVVKRTESVLMELHDEFIRCEERNTSRTIRRASTRVIYPILIFIFLTACGQKANQAPPPPPAVTVAQPIERPVTDYLELTGNTQAIMTVQLVARVTGYLEKVFFQDGQMVKRGQPLFLIQQNTYQDALQQAEGQVLLQKSQLDYAEKQLVRYSNLLEQKATSQENVDNWRYQRDSAQANLKVAEAARDLAKLNMSYTEITAPFDGRIDRRLQDPGNLVGSGGNTVLAEVNQIDPIYVYFNISDADLARLTGEARWIPGQARAKPWPLYVGLPNEKDYPHEGRLDFASISLTPSTGSLLLRGVFPNSDGKILPGLYARVRVPAKKRPALLVPEEAMGYDQSGSYVLVVNENNVVQRVSVRTGTLVDHLRVVEEGLSGKERVVIKGLQKAIPGRQVTPEREGVQTPGIGSPQRSDQKKAKP
jgi:RND family efflux transporter MFP subunit